jgi:hypothetical protein
MPCGSPTSTRSPSIGIRAFERVALAAGYRAGQRGAVAGFELEAEVAFGVLRHPHAFGHRRLARRDVGRRARLAALAQLAEHTPRILDALAVADERVLLTVDRDDELVAIDRVRAARRHVQSFADIVTVPPLLKSNTRPSSPTEV